MLKKLEINQFVIIDELTIDLKDRLTILTGETGAGKSILLSAMDLVLGTPSTPDSIRVGSEKSIFKATFAPSKNNPVWDYLVTNGLSKVADEEFIVYRVMKREGVDEITFNDKPIELETLAEIGVYLVEIHGQTANAGIMDHNNQLKWLDMSGGFPQEFFDNVRDALREVHRLEKELEEEKLFLVRHKRKIRQIEDLVKRFNSIGMGPKGFVAETQTTYEELLRAKETSDTFQNILGRMISASGVNVSLSAIEQILGEQENIDREQIADLEKYLSEALINSRKAVQEMMRLGPEYDIDTKPLNHHKDVLTVLHTISSENKVEFDDLEEFYEDISEKLVRIKNGREKVKELEVSLIEAKQSYKHHAHILTEKRIGAAEVLSNNITRELAPLKLPKAQFEILVEEKPDNPWTEIGFNEVTYMARMNPGSEFSSISNTASGGELARIILALKVVLQKIQVTSTLVFDEVDTGIGGAAAAAVGDRLALLSDNTQVVVITHSPQVASRGDQHLYISKKVVGNATTSAVRELTEEERIDEISRMLAGEDNTDASKAAAQSLIDEAIHASSVRQQEAAEENITTSEQQAS